MEGSVSSIEDSRSEYDYKFKIILIGDATVGKTSIIQRLNNPDPKVPLNTISTVGYEFSKKNITLCGENIQVHLWDTAGQDKFKSMIPTYFRKAAGCICVYDITNDKTFEGLDEWLQKLKSLGDDHVLTMVVGNKLDQEKDRMVSESDGAKYAKKNNAAFLEISAQAGINIQELFNTLFNEIYRSK